MVYGWQKLKSIDFWDRSKCSGRLALNEGVLGSVCASCLRKAIYRHRSSFKAKVCKGCLTKLFPAVFENPGEEYDEETEVTAPFSQPIDWQEDVSWQLDWAIIRCLYMPLTAFVGSEVLSVDLLLWSSAPNNVQHVHRPGTKKLWL